MSHESFYLPFLFFKKKTMFCEGCYLGTYLFENLIPGGLQTLVVSLGQKFDHVCCNITKYKNLLHNFPTGIYFKHIYTNSAIFPSDLRNGHAKVVGLSARKLTTNRFREPVVKLSGAIRTPKYQKFYPDCGISLGKAVVFLHYTFSNALELCWQKIKEIDSDFAVSESSRP